MIPSVALGHLISSLVSFSIAWKLYRSWQKNKDSKPLNYFFKFFLLLGINWSPLVNASPLISRNPYFLAITHDLAIPVLYLAMAYLIIVPLQLLHWFKLKKIFYYFFVIMAAVLAVINLWNFKPALSFTTDNYIYWLANIPPQVRTVTGYITPAVALTVVVFFILEAALTRQKYFMTRSLLISLGVLLMGMASVAHFLIGAPRGSFNFVSLTSVLVNGGLLLILEGIYYKRTFASAGNEPKKNAQAGVS